MQADDDALAACLADPEQLQAAFRQADAGECKWGW